MLTTLSSKSLTQFTYLFLSCIVFSANAQNIGVTDKITIVKMFNGQEPALSATLTINEPCGYPKTEGCGKPVKANYPFNTSRKYNSGTSFMTHSNVTILLRANGSTVQVQPNSLNRIQINSGNEVHSPRGVVRIVADKTRDIGKSIIVNGKNVSAKMKTTEFWVDTNGGQTKFSPVEGTISILEKVPVIVGSQKFNDQSENRERARKATYPIVTERSGGQQAYSTGQQAAKQYTSVNEAISALEDYVTEYEDYISALELAEIYFLLGQFYISESQYQNAANWFNKSAQEYTDLGSTGLDVLEAELFLSEAEINLGVTGSYEGVESTIEELLEELNYYYEEYMYANQIGDVDMQTGYCYEMVDALDLLGWAYDLIDKEEEADKYYKAASSYPCQD